MNPRYLLLVLAAVLATLVTPQVAAQSSSSQWQFSIAPYLWAAGMDGTMTVAAVEEEIDVPFSDVISNLDFALMGHFDMRNDRWVLSSDLIFVDLGQSEDVGAGTVTAGIDMTLLELVGGYRVSPAVALLAGARWVDMGASLRYTGELIDPDADVGKSWIDPLVGVNVFAPLSDRWWIGLRGDVGGFGVGSELTWQAYADVGFRASGLVSIILGYHALDMDYEDGDGLHYFGLDLMISGPQLGVVFTF
mgnify:FL=1|jgi:hypothetical protein